MSDEMSEIDEYGKRHLAHHLHEAAKYEAPVSLADKQQKRIADLEAQLAEAQRREGLPDSLLDLVRFMCNVWDKINDWAMNNVETDALMSYPMIQGIRNQMMLRMIGAQPYNTDKIREAVEWMINTQAAIDGGAMGG